ncbi:3-oxoacyl-[acyl-carrier protein] reductase [Catalinimonas alkaloidigena]|uniref:3-oxoacyl-[acyl-carrier protein] reductase n=1 Tax=Catalinimonas alkaloidigena TaxID=1075417 RepID=A0A1G9JZ56_9BACT|nr:SDR family NAD(P)-dependent oxidoreductase [Catalinimonas alkaloidigena]SDL42940.1 3-oxoacyl-[acyl-carrier protein] reductase [Catalinimonas alkaloidigena]
MTPTLPLLHNQVALVTGAGQGIGFAIARLLAQHGASVLLNDLDETLATRAATAIQQAGGTCHPLAGDVSDVAFLQHMVDEAVRQFGSLTIAVANAGITLFGNFFAYQPEALDRVMQVNLRGTFFLAQAAARQMRQQQRGGSLLFMSSVTGHQAHENLAAYGMTKAGIEMLAKSLVVELSPLGITVNAIAPGATATERTLEDATYEQTWARLTPMGRPATVDDIAQAALFLVSPHARHITGQSLVIDGGWSSVSPSPY